MLKFILRTLLFIGFFLIVASLSTAIAVWAVCTLDFEVLYGSMGIGLFILAVIGVIFSNYKN